MSSSSQKQEHSGPERTAFGPRPSCCGAQAGIADMTRGGRELVLRFVAEFKIALRTLRCGRPSEQRGRGFGKYGREAWNTGYRNF